MIEKTSLAAYSGALREKAESSSGRRANNIRIYTMSVARYARSEGMIAKVPFDHAPVRPEKRCGRLPFPLDDFKKYYEALDEYGRPLFLALAATGERVTAICGIDVSNILSDHGVVEIIKKGGLPRRIPLSTVFRQALAMGLDLTPKRGRKDMAVFVNSKGTRWNCMSFRHYTAKAWKAANLPDYTIHSLRNMVASNMADANASRDTISASLGHDQTATADIYVKAREKLLAAKRGLGDWSERLSTALTKSHNAPKRKKPRKTVEKWV